MGDQPNEVRQEACGTCGWRGASRGVGRAGNPYLCSLNELESGMYLALEEYLTSGCIITRTIVSLSLPPLLGFPNLLRITTTLGYSDLSLP